MIIIKSSFYFITHAKWMALLWVTLLGCTDIVLKDERSFFCSLWRGLLLYVVTDPPALGGLRALLSTLSPISNCEAGVLQMQQLFQKTKMKRVLKSFRQFRAREGFWTPSVDCNTTVAVLACLLFPLLFRCFLLFWDLFPLCIFLLFAPDEHKFI